MIKIYNWFLKQIFYFRYFVLQQGCNDLCGVDIIFPGLPTFESNTFNDSQWNKYLEWYLETKPFQDWNTIKYRTHKSTIKGFKQLYGEFYFIAKMQPYIIRQPDFPDLWSAIWLYDSRSPHDVEMGWADHPYGYEVDIELFRKHLGYTIHWNHNGGQEGETVVRANFGSKKLYQNLQDKYHLFIIVWDEKYIRYYINGLLTARFKNEIREPLQIIMSKVDMEKVVVKEDIIYKY